MASMWIWIWLGVICASAIIEFITVQMVTIWFVAGGLVGLILALCGVEIWIQVVVAIMVTLILLISLRRLCVRYLTKQDTTKTNVDSLIGQEFKLLEDITEDKSGSVKANGIVWTAVAEKEDTKIKAQTMVVVKEIKGNKLVVTTKGE